MAKMIKPTTCFFHKDLNMSMIKNVPVVLEDEAEAEALINSRLAVEYEEVHPEGNLEITTRGEFDVTRYAKVTVNPTIVTVTFYGGANHEESTHQVLILGDSLTLLNEEQYRNRFTIEENTRFDGWSTVKNNPETKVGTKITPEEDTVLYAVILPVEGEEEIPSE